MTELSTLILIVSLIVLANLLLANILYAKLRKKRLRIWEAMNNIRDKSFETQQAVLKEEENMSDASVDFIMKNSFDITDECMGVMGELYK